MNQLTLYLDPTSEPCRAVHWLCVQADIDFLIEHIWLSRNQHLGEAFLKINPLHQVPALKHENLCLSEATAIMRYIADLSGKESQWFGKTQQDRAIINQGLSWYHLNLKRVVTLEETLINLEFLATQGCVANFKNCK
ncbi:hypothetical protein MAH1_24600 [Sessilibacter sp. MAH1]